MGRVRLLGQNSWPVPTCHTVGSSRVGSGWFGSGSDCLVIIARSGWVGFGYLVIIFFARSGYFFDPGENFGTWHDRVGFFWAGRVEFIEWANP
jgi:hypothetical protein